MQSADTLGKGRVQVAIEVSELAQVSRDTLTIYPMFGTSLRVGIFDWLDVGLRAGPTGGEFQAKYRFTARGAPLIISVAPAVGVSILDTSGVILRFYNLALHREIAPIFAARCSACHAGFGPGPLKLTTYSEVLAANAVIHHSVTERRMPPWPPAACCSEYRHTAALTPDELGKVVSWLETGMTEGVAAPPPPLSTRSRLDRIDLTVTMSEPYLPAPIGSHDETRCFLIDWPPTEAKYVTGIDILPGVPGQMHHSIAFVAGPSDVKTLTAVDAAAPGPGWPCPGGVLGSFKDALGGAAFAPTLFDDGLGHEVLPDDKLVLQMHYSAPSAGDFKPDQSSVLLRLQSEPTRRMTTLMVFNPAWLIPRGMQINAGQKITYSYADDPTRWAGGKPFKLHSVSLHMHERGVKGQVAILRADGTRECLLQIDAWDHAWQSDYAFVTPKRIEKGDRLLASCSFDNSESNQKVVDGVRQPPADLDWSEEKEMCIAFVSATQD